MSAAIAIVGMACHFPDADSPHELWRKVLARRRAFRRLPAEWLRIARMLRLRWPYVRRTVRDMHARGTPVRAGDLAIDTYVSCLETLDAPVALSFLVEGRRR